MKLLNVLTRHFWQRWLPLAVLATATAMLVYATVQQNYRQSANDPQVQMAEDATDKLAKGVPIAEFAPTEIIDMRRSLSPFMIVVDENVNLLSSTAKLDNDSPIPPKGVFAAAAKSGENRLTWQAAKGVRVAIVVRPFNGGSIKGFVVAGRSLREVEDREDKLTAQIFFGWLATLLLTAIAVNITDPR